MAKLVMEKLQAGKMARQAIEFTRDCIERIGSRPAGSQNCIQAAKEIAKSFELYCDSVEQESFAFHPKAFLGWIRILVVIYPIALLFSLFSFPLVSAMLMTAGALIMVFEFLLYRKIIDPLYPASRGLNVYGIMEPQEETRQTIIFSAHHDSAHIFSFLLDKPHLYRVRVGIGLGAFVLFAVLSIVQMAAETLSSSLFSFGLASPFFRVLDGVLAAALPWVCALWRFVSEESSPGAGDNLVSSAMAVQLARYFDRSREQGQPLRHTRLIVASFDAEEVGLRGSREFYRRHQKEFASVPAWNLNADCIYHAKDLCFLTSDINGSVKLSQQMATRCVTIAKAMGFEAFSQPIAFLAGGTDAAEAAKAGIEAVTLMAMPWSNKDGKAVYHTPQDLPEAIDVHAIEEAISIAIRFIEQFDAEVS